MVFQGSAVAEVHENVSFLWSLCGSVFGVPFSVDLDHFVVHFRTILVCKTESYFFRFFDLVDSGFHLKPYRVTLLFIVQGFSTSSFRDEDGKEYSTRCFMNSSKSVARPCDLYLQGNRRISKLASGR